MFNFFRRKLLDISIPLTRFISIFHSPECRIISTQYIDLHSNLKNGDILVCEREWEFTNLFMPSLWKHCAIYCNGWVYESTTKGTRKILLEEFCFKKDIIAISRFCCSLSDAQISKGIYYLESNLREPYDFGFTWKGTKSWYCSKFVYHFFCTCVPWFADSFSIQKVLGEKTIKPDAYWNTKYFYPVRSYNGKGKQCAAINVDY